MIDISLNLPSLLDYKIGSTFHNSTKLFCKRSINYRIALEEEDADRLLYLAVPLDIYKQFFKYTFIQTVIRRNQIPLLVYDIEKQEVSQWIS